MNRAFGYLFLVFGLGALAFAYMMGANDGNGFRIDTLMRLGGIWPVVGGVVCLFLALLMLRKKTPVTPAP